jgi:hypothetical protein
MAIGGSPFPFVCGSALNALSYNVAIVPIATIDVTRMAPMSDS